MSLSDQDLMNQSKDTAHDYMMAAIRSIDEKFGEGYAKNNPQLVGDFMKTASIDFLTCSGLQAIATSLDFVAEQISNVAESIDCAAVNHIEFWMQSDEAAIDKAKELNINILPSYSMDDLRYKIHQSIHEVI